MPDSAQTLTDGILRELDSSWRRLLERIEAVPAERWDEPGLCGVWSLRLVVAHIAFWDRWEHDVLAGAVSGEHVDWQTLNEQAATAASGRTSGALRSELSESHDRLVQQLRALESVDAVALREDTVEHYDEHAAEIEWWLLRTRTTDERAYDEPEPIAGILSRLDDAWDAWLRAIDEVPESAREVPGVSDGWSVKQLIGHVTFWESQLIDDLVGYQAGRPPIALDVDGWNAREAVRTAALSVSDLMADMHATHARMRSLLEGCERVDPHMVAVDTWEHYPDHARDIRAWLSATAGA